MDLPSATELDTFKIISNSDTVDWSRTLRPPPRFEEEEEWGGGGALSEPEVVLPPNHEPLHRIVKSLDMEEQQAPTPPPARRSMTPPLPPSPPRPVQQEEEERVPSPQRSPQVPPVHIPRDPSPEPAPPRRAVRAPVRYTPAQENEDYEIKAEKEAILNEILGYARPPHNFKLTREWSVENNTLDELQFELDRINSELSATGIIDMAKSGIKFGVSGIEMFLKQQGLDAADGWYNNSCKDMNKFNRPLTRLYKKYWRNTQLSPMMELGYLLGGSLAWTIAENKMGFRKSNAAPPAAAVAADIPRAAGFEAPRMRPPSNNFAPKWGAQEAAPVQAAAPTQAAPVQVAPTQVAAPVQVVPPQPSVSDEMMKKLTAQNDLMIQLLQGMATSRPAVPPSPKSGSTSPNIRIRSFGTGRKSTRTPHVIKKTNVEEETLSL